MFKNANVKYFHKTQMHKEKEYLPWVEARENIQKQ